jgi:adenylosuccinate synthase
VLLGVNLGTYPKVTSSNPGIGGAIIGSGIPYSAISLSVGVFKAYQSRVGNGPFPTELFDAICDHIRARGNEYGTNTKRPRRCGWLDLVLLRYACDINGFTELAMMKLDVLDELGEIQVCVGYEGFDGMPENMSDLGNCVPIYRTFKGWKKPTSDIRDFNLLPYEAQMYIRRVEEIIETKIGLVSVAPDKYANILLPGSHLEGLVDKSD